MLPFAHLTQSPAARGVPASGLQQQGQQSALFNQQRNDSSLLARVEDKKPKGWTRCFSERQGPCNQVRGLKQKQMSLNVSSLFASLLLPGKRGHAFFQDGACKELGWLSSEPLHSACWRQNCGLLETWAVFYFCISTLSYIVKKCVFK